MKKELALKIILIISIIGMLFSGYLSYKELFAESCTSGCRLSANSSTIGGIPVCVYGFVMYFLVFIITILGLKKTDKKV